MRPGGAGQISQIAAAYGGEPSPPSALLFSANFQTASYEVNGSAAVLSDILVENSDWGSFTPAAVIDAAGLNFVAATDCLPVFASAFSALAAGDGITIVGVLDVGDAATAGMIVELNDAPTYAQENSFGISRDTTTVVDLSGSDTQAGPGAGVCTFAANVQPDRIAISVDGGAVLGRNVPTTTFTLLCMSYFGSLTPSSLRTLTGRDLVTESDLPALSTP